MFRTSDISLGIRTPFSLLNLSKRIRTTAVKTSRVPRFFCQSSNSDESIHFSGMELVTLGTSSGIPSLTRTFSANALRMDSSVWLFDCGEGTQHQILKSVVKLSLINKIFITHLHGDHVYGLPGLLVGLSNARISASLHDPINVYGPIGLGSFVRTALHFSSAIIPPELIAIHEMIPLDMPHLTMPSSSLALKQKQDQTILPDANGIYEIFHDENYQVLSAPLKHRIHSWGFVVIEKDKQGRLLVDKLQEYQISPGRIYSHIKSGSIESVFLPDGSTIKSNEFIGPPKKGRKLVLLGDTCDSHRIEDIARNADLLLHECTLMERDFEKAITFGHSTGKMAGAFANKIKAKKLVLTHFGNRNQENEEERIKESVLQASEHFREEIIAAYDLLRVPIVRPKIEI